jgi:hypothetical protein
VALPGAVEPGAAGQRRAGDEPDDHHDAHERAVTEWRMR